ncbi:hypothetical protein HY970_03665 [Candidatus Kaiserbacteria bacterium]|nr:hypothetical protein [Candidatus Kaiserbacteria bacterium]
MRQYTYITVFVATVLVALFGIVLLGPADNFLAKRAAANVVVDFGQELQNVSLHADPDVVREGIREHYAPYVTENLLETWLDTPNRAPGRLTSSPWPARIEVRSATRQGSGYIVQGNVVLMTSAEVEHGGNAGLVPFIMQVTKEGGKWKIVAYEEPQTTR